VTAASRAGEAAATHKLWGGRFSTEVSTEFDALNSSIGVDYRLWPHDVRLSKAWAVALYHAGVLSLEESDEIERGLDRVAARLESREAPAPSDEDVHTSTASVVFNVPAGWATSDGYLYKSLGAASEVGIRPRAARLPCA